jgi:hypothetical protein
VLRSDRTERKEEIEIGNLIERQIEKELVSVNISEELLNIQLSNTFHLALCTPIVYIEE